MVANRIVQKSFVSLVESVFKGQTPARWEGSSAARLRLAVFSLDFQILSIIEQR